MWQGHSKCCLVERRNNNGVHAQLPIAASLMVKAHMDFVLCQSYNAGSILSLTGYTAMTTALKGADKQPDSVMLLCNLFNSQKIISTRNCLPACR